MSNMQSFYENLVQGSIVSGEMGDNLAAPISTLDESYLPLLLRLTQLKVEEITTLSEIQGWEAWG